MLTIIVKRVLIDLTFPFLHYSISRVTAVELLPRIWENIRTLYASFKVISLTGNGCSANRNFFFACTDQQMETLIQ